MNAPEQGKLAVPTGWRAVRQRRRVGAVAREVLKVLRGDGGSAVLALSSAILSNSEVPRRLSGRREFGRPVYGANVENS